MNYWIIWGIYFFQIVYGDNIELSCNVANPDDFNYRNFFPKELYHCGLEPKVKIAEKDNIGIILDHLQNKSDSDIQSVSISGNNLNFIPTEIYTKFSNINYLAFQHNHNIKSLDPKWFNNSINLKGFFYRNGNFKKLDGNLFIGATNLEKLGFYNCGIEEIHANAFTGLKKLELLIIDWNKITKLEANMFKNLINIKYLFLYKNEISYINSQSFNSLDSLIELDLAQNLIYSLDKSTFKLNFKLRKIILLHNYISKMSNTIFSHMKNLLVIDLKENVCVNVFITSHNYSIKFTEDILTPCSCEAVKNFDSELFLKKLTKVLCALSITIFIISILLITKCFGNGKGIKKGNRVHVIDNSVKNETNDFQFSNILEEYRNVSSIHGISYIFNKNNACFNRTLWLAVVLASLFGFTYYTVEVFIRWQERPVVLGFDEQTVSIFEIPFPAVTICFDSKYSNKNFHLQNSYREFLKSKNKTNYKDLSKLKTASVICGINKINILRREINDDPTPHFENYFQDMPSIQVSYYWNYEYSYYTSINTFTETGICQTFNYIDGELIFRNKTVDKKFLHEYQTLDRSIANPERPHGWSLEQGYDPNTIGNYPMRTFKNGINSALQILASISEHDYELLDEFCLHDTKNLRITLHHPTDIPDVSDNYFLIPYEKRLQVLVTPKITKTSKNLDSYDPSVRQCYFQGERQLKFFEIYSKSNCELECLTNMTLRYCNCSNFYMPRTSGTKICNYRDHQYCQELAKRAILIELQVNLNCKMKSEDNIRCSCFPACNEVTYDADVLINNDYVREPKSEDGKALIWLTEITIFFKENQFMATLRSERYGFIDFISNCGGLMGLFMGVSVLSLVELFYYFIVLTLQKRFNRTD